MNMKSIYGCNCHGKMFSFLQLMIFCILISFSPISIAQWHIASHENLSNDGETRVAFTENKEGYTLEIYKDSVGAVRARFTLNSKLNLFPANICPTYQVDLTLVKNTSFNDAPCISKLNWSEFILGYLTNKNITSLSLDALLNGNTVTFRFSLDNGNYKETSFSLTGSKRAALSVIGKDININP